MQFLSKRSARLGLSALSGLLLGLTLIFPVLGALEWFALVPFSLVLFYGLGEEEKWRRRFADLLSFFGTYFLLVYHWFLYMYSTVASRTGAAGAVAIVLLAWIGLAALVAVPGAFWFLLWKPIASCSFIKKHRWLTPFLAAALWTVFEWATTLTFAGVPWSRLGIGQTKMLAVIQTASLFGSYFITFLIVAVGFCIGYAIFYRKRIFWAIPMVLFSVNLIVGGAMLAGYEVETQKPVKIAAIQGNTPSAEKWNSEGFFNSLDRHFDMTIEAGRAGADIVLWSESVIPGSLVSDFSWTKPYIVKTVKEGGSLLVFGGFDEDEEGRQYNALFLMERDGNIVPDRYYKRHLVPFGEYFLFRSVLEKVAPTLTELLAGINELDEDVYAAKDCMLIESEYGTLGALICFDSIYEELSRESVNRGAEILLLSTNDSWFGDSAALYMHNAQAVLRAVENRRFVVRAANTGISSVISPTGEVLSSLGEGETGYLIEDVYMHSDITLYTAVGNVFVAFCGVYIAILLGIALIDKKKKAA